MGNNTWCRGRVKIRNNLVIGIGIGIDIRTRIEIEIETEIEIDNKYKYKIYRNQIRPRTNKNRVTNLKTYQSAKRYTYQQTAQIPM